MPLQGNGDSGQDSDDDDNHHQLNKGKTLSGSEDSFHRLGNRDQKKSYVETSE
jgi:hypothetical protein